MTDDDLHDDIDEFAREVEQRYQGIEERLDDLPEFDSKYRRMQEADVENIDIFA